MTHTTHHARRLAAVVAATLVLIIGGADVVAANDSYPTRSDAPGTSQATTAWLAARSR